MADGSAVFTAAMYRRDGQERRCIVEYILILSRSSRQRREFRSAMLFHPHMAILLFSLAWNTRLLFTFHLFIYFNFFRSIPYRDFAIDSQRRRVQSGIAQFLYFLFSSSRHSYVCMTEKAKTRIGDKIERATMAAGRCLRARAYIEKSLGDTVTRTTTGGDGERASLRTLYRESRCTEDPYKARDWRERLLVSTPAIERALSRRGPLAVRSTLHAIYKTAW